jgi:hypothetical protein
MSHLSTQDDQSNGALQHAGIRVPATSYGTPNGPACPLNEQGAQGFASRRCRGLIDRSTGVVTSPGRLANSLVPQRHAKDRPGQCPRRHRGPVRSRRQHQGAAACDRSAHRAFVHQSSQHAPPRWTGGHPMPKRQNTHQSPRLGAQHRVATRALVEPLARVRRHRLRSGETASRAGDGRFQLAGSHAAELSGRPGCYVPPRTRARDALDHAKGRLSRLWLPEPGLREGPANEPIR